MLLSKCVEGRREVYEQLFNRVSGRVKEKEGS
jgi:hypothetical protein